MQEARGRVPAPVAQAVHRNRRADDGDLGQIDPHEALLSVSGDGAYDTKACHEAIALRQAQAIIPVRKNDKMAIVICWRVIKSYLPYLYKSNQ